MPFLPQTTVTVQNRCPSGSFFRFTHIVAQRIEAKHKYIYINFSAIQYPNCHYVKGKTKDDKESHAAALRYIDSQLPRQGSARK